jgi:hypothetical protein
MNIKSYAYDKKAWATLIIVLLIGLSWLGNIDKHADRYTHESIIQAGTAYASARGINAIVSILQTSTVEVGFIAGGAVSVGEILDPINDLIERFSSVMIVAFGSLVLQKMLMVIVSHELFNSAVTLLGIISIIMIYVGKAGSLQTTLRLFILFSFVRFSLGIVVLLNSGVDYIFLDSQINAGSENLDVFHSDLDDLNNPDLDRLTKREYVDVKKIEMLNKSIQDDKDRIALLEHESIPDLKSKLGEAEDRVADSEAMLQDLKKEIPWWMFGINESQEVKAAKELLSSNEDARDKLLSDISKNESLVKDVKEDIVSKREDIADENDGSLAVYVSAAVGNIIDLVVLFILKAVLIPLLFFYLLIKVARGIWDVNWGEVFVGNNLVAVSSA